MRPKYKKDIIPRDTPLNKRIDAYLDFMVDELSETLAIQYALGYTTCKADMFSGSCPKSLKQRLEDAAMWGKLNKGSFVEEARKVLLGKSKQ